MLGRGPGTGTGGCHETWGRVVSRVLSWEEEISRAKRPAGARRRAAIGRLLAKRSTARRVTTSKVAGGSVSARAFCILTSVNVRARVTSWRKAAFLWLDSISVRAMYGAQSLM